MPITRFVAVRVVWNSTCGGFFVDRDQRPGFLDQRPNGGRFHVLMADVREIHQALADPLEALRDSLHARQTVQGGRSSMVSISFSIDPFEDGEGRVQLVRDARGEQAEADQAVLFFQAAQRGGEFVLLPAERGDRFVAGAHDLADFVAQDFTRGIISRSRSPVWVAASASSMRRRGRYT